LEHGLENEGNGYSIRDRTNAVAKHLLAHPDDTNDDTNEDGENITDSVVTALVNTAIARCHTAEELDEDERTVRHLFEIEEFRREYPALERAFLLLTLLPLLRNPVRPHSLRYQRCVRCPEDCRD
jgi:hypothetical protein